MIGMKKLGAISVLLTGMVMSTLMTGCGKEGDVSATEPGTEMTSSQQESSETAETQETQQESQEQTKESEQEDQDKNPVLEPPVEDTDPVEQQGVVNNNGHFVQMDGKIYFHVVDADFMYRTALWGDYADTEAGRTVLMEYDPATGKVTPVDYDYASGILAVESNRLFQNVYYDDDLTVEGYTASGVIGKSLENSDNMVEIGTSQENLLGAGENSSYIALYHYSYENYEEQKYILIYKNGGLINKVEVSDYMECIALGQDAVFYKGRTDEGCYLMQLDVLTGEIINLGQLPEMGSYGGTIDECLLVGDHIYLAYSLYEGTGYFFTEGYFVQAEIGKADSLVAEDMPGNPDVYGDPHFATFGVINGKMVQSDGEPGTCSVSEEGVLGYYNEHGTWVPVAYGFGYEELSEEEDNKSVELAELVGDSIYVIVNHNERAPEDDIGWRYAYRRRYTYIYRVNIETGEKEELLTQASPRG